jgi:hypothetical protein
MDETAKKNLIWVKWGFYGQMLSSAMLIYFAYQYVILTMKVDRLSRQVQEQERAQAQLP